MALDAMPAEQRYQFTLYPPCQAPVWSVGMPVHVRANHQSGGHAVVAKLPQHGDDRLLVRDRQGRQHTVRQTRVSQVLRGHLLHPSPLLLFCVHPNQP